MQMEEIISTAGLHTKGTSGHADTRRQADGVNPKGGQARTTGLDEVELSQDKINLEEYNKALESLRNYTGCGNFNVDFATDDPKRSASG